MATPCNSRPGRDGLRRDRTRHLTGGRPCSLAPERRMRRGDRLEYLGERMLFVGHSPNGRLWCAPAGAEFEAKCAEFDHTFPRTGKVITARRAAVA